MSVSDDENETYKQFEIHEGIAFLIELTPEIFLPLKELDNKSQFMEILSSINDLIGELIITLPNTGIGIYFYNCQKTNKRFTKDCGLNRLFKLNDLNSFNMKILNDAINDDINGISLLKDKFPYIEEDQDDKLPAVLNTMLNEFHNNKNYNNKKLIWFTNNDRPFKRDKTKHNLWKIINDYDEFRINITPFFLDSYADEKQSKKKEFNPNLYQEIFLNTNYLNNRKGNDNDDDVEKGTNIKPEFIQANMNDIVFDGISNKTAKFKDTTLSTQIKSIILRLREIKRILFSCDLILGDGKGVSGKFGCSVKGYTIYNHERLKKFNKIYNSGEELKIVHTSSKMLNNRTGEEIEVETENKKSITEKNEDANIRKGFPMGNDNVLYLNSKQTNFLKNYAFDHNFEDKSEAAKVEDENEDENEDEYDDNEDLDDHSFSKPPYLKLLGFRSLSTYQSHYNSSAPIFVTPDMNDGLKTSSADGGYKNSFKTFSSLYQSCIKLQKYGILFGCLKKNSMPNLYSLYPTKVTNSQKSGLNFPEGFFLIRLPWLDDVRSLPEYSFLNDAYLNDLSGESVPADILLNFKHIISQFFLREYRPLDFPNPSINFFYKIINNELLQEELSPESKSIENNDITTQKLIELRGYLQKEEIQTMLKALNVRLNKLSNESLKREMESSDGTDSKKRKKEVPELSEEAVLTAWKSNEWGQFTVWQLKQFISKYKGLIKLATKKQDLINSIIQFLDKKYENGN